MAAELPRQELHHGMDRRGTIQEPRDRSGSAESGRAEGVKLPVYKHLLDVNAGFDQAIEGLAALRKNDAFVARQLDRYVALVKETRAATNSYLIGVLERAETKEAGQRFGRRRDRELKEE
jgi:hypothetical protein